MDSEHISIEMDTRICGHGIGYSLCPTCRPATIVENPFSGTNSETKSHDTAPRLQNIVKSKLLDRHTGPPHASKPNMLETISGGLRQISNQYKQKVKDRQTAIQLALLPKSVKAVNKLKGFVLGCPGSKRTFVIPYHIMLSIVSFIGEVVECEVTGYSKTNNRSAKFEEQWGRVTGGDYNRGPREQIQAVLGKPYENGSYIHKYTYKMACFYFDDLLLSSNIYDSHDTIPEYILTRGRQSYRLIPHLQAQLKYFTSHYHRTHYKLEKFQRGYEKNSYGSYNNNFRSRKKEYIFERTYATMKGDITKFQVDPFHTTAITSREKEIARNVINLELNNCKLYHYPQQPSTFDAFVNGEKRHFPQQRDATNAAFYKPVHCFVRDIQSLSSISCVNQQLHQFILNSPLWSSKQQLNMKRFQEQQAIAIASLEPKIQKLLEKKVVIDVASEFSNQWTKNKKSETCMYIIPYCVMCLFCGLIWIPVAAYVEAQDRFCSANAHSKHDGEAMSTLFNCVSVQDQRMTYGEYDDKINDKGGDGCTPLLPCGNCQGDCDTDDDCENFLECYHRSATTSLVPGCSSWRDEFKHDFCYSSNKKNYVKTTKTIATNATQFTDVGISKYSDSYSFELLTAGFIIAGVMISCLCLPIFFYNCPRCRCRKMLKYCFTIGCKKTCEAMKLAGRTRSEDFWQKASILCMVLILVMVGPLMLLFRSYLWGSMSHAEQIATGGSPERSLFVVWPYFIGLVVGFPLIAVALWYQTFREDENSTSLCSDFFLCSKVIEKEKVLVSVCGIIIVLHITGLLLWNMKLDNSVLVEQNVSGLTCSIPIIIGLALCTIYPCIHSLNKDGFYFEYVYPMIGLTFWHFIVVVSPPLTLLIILIHQFDYGSDIQLWVYPVVVCSIWCCFGSCMLFFLSMLSGMGSS